MTNKLYKVITVFVIIGSAVLFSRCQSEETEINNNKASVINAKEWLENNKISLEVL